ncbi:MAG: hypothetical protein LBL19_01280 [Spirochaetaceae bacterium]|jgi:hypothetical protein|nr:hypothetical protein [Spirochaetaceae bacterium]
MAAQTDRSRIDFWAEYEKQHGEKVLAYVLGKYLSGWPEYSYPLWGLLIATEGGFRFHHFPHEGWIQALSRMTSGGQPPQEKTIFIPRERLLSAEIRTENCWWKKILAYRPPVLAIQYHNGNPETGPAGELLAEADKDVSRLIPFLRAFAGQAPQSTS